MANMEHLILQVNQGVISELYDKGYKKLTIDIILGWAHQTQETTHYREAFEYLGSVRGK